MRVASRYLVLSCLSLFALAAAVAAYRSDRGIPAA